MEITWKMEINTAIGDEKMETIAKLRSGERSEDDLRTAAPKSAGRSEKVRRGCCQSIDGKERVRHHLARVLTRG
jgi:hypothetical protein